MAVAARFWSIQITKSNQGLPYLMQTRAAQAIVGPTAQVQQRCSSRVFSVLDFFFGFEVKSSQFGLELSLFRSSSRTHWPTCHIFLRTRTRTNTNPNGTEANAAGRSGNARALRKQSKCGMFQEGEGHWPNSSKNLQKARNLWVLRTPQNNKEEGARARKLVTCGTRSPLGRGQSVPFSAQGAYCSAPEP